MTQERIQANRYEFKGRQTQITYEETAFDGKPHLTYQVAQGPETRTFVGEQIRTQENEIGRLVTVTLQAVEDGDSTLLTLLVPTVNLGDMREQPVETIAILTTERSSIAGPSLVTGAVQSYHTVKLKGKAQFVVS